MALKGKYLDFVFTSGFSVLFSGIGEEEKNSVSFVCMSINNDEYKC